MQELRTLPAAIVATAEAARAAGAAATAFARTGILGVNLE